MIFFKLDVISFKNFFYLFIFGLFVETSPFTRVVNFVSAFYFLLPAEQSTKEATYLVLLILGWKLYQRK